MINRIIEPYLDYLKGKGILTDDTFIENEFTKMATTLKITNLPERVLSGAYIDKFRLPKVTNNLYNMFEDCCYSIDSTLVCVDRFNMVQYISGMLIEKLYKRCLIEDVTLPIILYIDTEEFVSDLGSLIGQEKNSSDRAPRLRNSLDVIYEYIYTARYVIWDRFRLDFSSYYNNYIFKIIKGRYKDCLGNMFFTDKSYTAFMKEYDPDTIDILNIKTGIFDIINEQKQGMIHLIEGGK